MICDVIGALPKTENHIVNNDRLFFMKRAASNKTLKTKNSAAEPSKQRRGRLLLRTKFSPSSLGSSSKQTQNKENLKAGINDKTETDPSPRWRGQFLLASMKSKSTSCRRDDESKSFCDISTTLEHERLTP
jgi:hypothetical protein